MRVNYNKNLSDRISYDSRIVQSGAALLELAIVLVLLSSLLSFALGYWFAANHKRNLESIAQLAAEFLRRDEIYRLNRAAGPDSPFISPPDASTLWDCHELEPRARYMLKSYAGPISSQITQALEGFGYSLSDFHDYEGSIFEIESTFVNVVPPPIGDEAPPIDDDSRPGPHQPVDAIPYPNEYADKIHEIRLGLKKVSSSCGLCLAGQILGNNVEAYSRVSLTCVDRDLPPGASGGSAPGSPGST